MYVCNYSCTVSIQVDVFKFSKHTPTLTNKDGVTKCEKKNKKHGFCTEVIVCVRVRVC